jgi:hypothetical protein
MASFRFKIKFVKSRHYALTASFRFKIKFENSQLPTHGEFWIQNQIRKLVTTHSRRVFDSKSYSKTRHYALTASFRLKIKFENSSLRTHGEFLIQNHIWKLATPHSRRVFDSKSNSKTRHYALTASFSIKNQIRKLATSHTWRVLDSKSNSKTRHYALTASFRFKIIFENSPLPTHGEFLIQNQIRKLVTTHSRWVFDSKSNSKTCHYPHMASFGFKIIFENSPLHTHGEFSIQNQIRKLATTHTWLVFDSKSNSKTRHYALTASFGFKIKLENSPLPTHGEFWIQNKIRKLVTTPSRRVFDSKSYSKTRHLPHTASFQFKIKFENLSLRTHGEFSIQNHIRKLATTHTRRVSNSKSNSKTRHYALTASFWFKILFENSPLPTHGEFSIQNQIRKLVTTHSRRVFD